uniref:C-type lectin domain-containing protein n=1 Tax=Salarias fasciatus TaxID=181472 RepID=A0A672HWD3_SALFA
MQEDSLNLHCTPLLFHFNTFLSCTSYIFASKKNFILYLIGFGLISSSNVVHPKYHYINLNKMWTEAQQYCRQFYDDLAAFESQDDIDELDRPSFIGGYAWIGLWDDPEAWNGTMGNGSNSWRWSGAESTSTTGYHYMHIERVDNWEDAQSYCRINYTDLAMIENEQENKKVLSLITGHKVWIGLYREAWMWSDGSSKSFWKWRTQQPDNANFSQSCVAEYPDHDWDDRPCQSEIPFICQGEDIHPIEEKKKWKDAQSYCRINYTDLAMIENDQENQKVLSLITGHEVWIGLYREPWMWSDGSNSSFQNWRTGEPDNEGYSQSCAAEYPDHDWDDSPCQSEIPFICQGGKINNS